MKKLFLAALLVVGITTFAQDKENKGPEGRDRLTTEQKVDLQTKRMTKDLDLNDKQAKDIKDLLTKEFQKREAKMAEMKQQKAAKVEKREEMKAKMEAEEASLKSEMKKILTSEQYIKWDKSREERKTKMMEKMKENRGGELMERDNQPSKPEGK